MVNDSPDATRPLAGRKTDTGLPLRPAPTASPRQPRSRFHVRRRQGQSLPESSRVGPAKAENKGLSDFHALRAHHWNYVLKQG